MDAENDIVFGNPHFNQFLTDIDIGGVLLEPDFAVLDIKVQNRMINPPQAIPANPHELIAIALGIEAKRSFNLLFVGHGFPVAFEQGLNTLTLTTPRPRRDGDSHFTGRV